MRAYLGLPRNPEGVKHTSPGRRTADGREAVRRPGYGPGVEHEPQRGGT